ncbi:hypothetical protein EDB86DRAFT_2952728, partial [Lactarius hatsudake]
MCSNLLTSPILVVNALIYNSDALCTSAAVLTFPDPVHLLFPRCQPTPTLTPIHTTTISRPRPVFSRSFDDNSNKKSNWSFCRSKKQWTS